MQYKKALFIAAGFAGGAVAYKGVQRALDPIINKKAEEYAQLTEAYYKELLKKGKSEDEAIAEVYKKYPHPLWKKLGSNRIEALALLGVSTALTLTKSEKLDNIAKGMIVFSAIKSILPSQKLFIESWTDGL